MGIYLLSAGANYRGESCELPDCDLDVDRMLDDFDDLGPAASGMKRLFERAATRKGVIKALKAFLDKLKPGDLGLLFWSGHGSTEMVDGKSAQAIVCYGLEPLYEFEIRQILADRKPGVMLGMAADSCYSGGLHRAVRYKRSVPARYLSHVDVQRPAKAQVKLSFAFEACSSTETATSTGKGGAWSLAFHEAWLQRTDRTKLPDLHRAIRKQLPSKAYPQTPQFQCADALARRTVKSFGQQ